MSILSDTAILAARARGEIVIEPFDPACLGGNSYDVHLGPYLATYARRMDVRCQNFKYVGVTPVFEPLDCAIDNPIVEHVIGPNGIVLEPNKLYLGATVEYTETHRHVPYLDGRSSTGRLGISIHETAGRGDVGWRGPFTLEITTVHPIRVYAGMRIGQLTFHIVEGEVERIYHAKPGATYAGDSRNPKPVRSGMWRQFKERG